MATDDPRSDAEARYDALCAEAKSYWPDGVDDETRIWSPSRMRDSVVAYLLAEEVERLRASAPPAITDANGLLPCPFCGSDRIVRGNFGEMAWWMRCNACGTEGPSDHANGATEEAAAKNWNRRVSAPRQETQEIRLSAETKAQIEVWCMDVERGTHQGSHVAESIIEAIEHPEKLGVAAPPPEER